MTPNNFYLKNGDFEMEAFMREFFTEEQERAAIRNGKTQMAKINKMYMKEKKSLIEISKEVELSVEKVKQALAELGYDFE